MIGIRKRKSAGVPVSATVYAAIQQGNRARNAQDWTTAATAYRVALSLHPTLHHIWIQLGHMLKNGNHSEDALAAYEEANQLKPQDGEARTYIAHIHKNEGRTLLAARCFAAMVTDGHQVDEAARELAEIIKPVVRFSADQIRMILLEDGDVQTPDLSPATAALSNLLTRLALNKETAQTVSAIDAAHELITRIDRGSTENAIKRPGDDDRKLVFDVSDLAAHFRHHRLPTGIQRVQIEVLAAALKDRGSEQIGICCFIDGRDYWVEIPVPRFLKLAYLSSLGSDADWERVRQSFFLHLALDEPYDLPERAILINLGTSWWIYDYFRLIREARQTKGITYIAMVYDLIPILAPQYCVSGITEDYVTWVVGVFQHADGYFAISESTKRDLIAVASKLGYELPTDRVEVVPLDADFRRLAIASLPTTTLGTWQLEHVPYALFVSTIEARKNHDLAFVAWAELIRRYGRNQVPRLVCVGRNGWLNEQAFARLAADEDLRAHVTIINQASDEELALLYKSCQFTIYPSHYEGWGLPVTESLCYGRVPIVANNSSLPEAGGDFALMFESDSSSALVTAVEKVTFDHSWREVRQAQIELSFRPRQWASIFSQIAIAATKLTSGYVTAVAGARRVDLGVYYPMRLYRGKRIWRSLASGEVFRAGEGWLWPETNGCRTTLAGGKLCMRMASGQCGPLRVYMHVRGLSTRPCSFVMQTAGAVILTARLRANESRWVMADLPAQLEGDISIVVKGEAAEQIEMSTGGTLKHLMSSITIVGFALCHRNDLEQRSRFIEAVVLGEADDISAYRQDHAA